MIIDEEAALQTLEMFQHGSYGLQSDKAVSDNVAQHRLNTSSSLSDEPWLGTKEEELDSWVLLNISNFNFSKHNLISYISELVYIHSKLMVVDDRRVIVSPSLCVFIFIFME